MTDRPEMGRDEVRYPAREERLENLEVRRRIRQWHTAVSRLLRGRYLRRLALSRPIPTDAGTGLLHPPGHPLRARRRQVQDARAEPVRASDDSSRLLSRSSTGAATRATSTESSHPLT